LYLPFIGGGFLTDDYAHVARLSAIDRPERLVTRPDAFGFYRPVTQASIAIDLAIHGQRPARLRALNVVLHAIVIGLAFWVARLVLASPFAAAMATLAFALTPKAAPITVLWISARAELLMAMFSFLAVGSWIRWTRGAGAKWLVTACAAYLLALLSKETATLLPLLLLVTPAPRRTWPWRVASVVGLCGLAVAVYSWRAHVGALTPFSGDAHYDLTTPLARWSRSATNYSGRLAGAPLVLVALFAFTRFIVNRGWRWVPDPREPAPGVLSTAPGGAGVSNAPHVIAFSIVWVAVFLVPVLPIVLRSELYLYLPVFGVCLLAGLGVEFVVRDIARRRPVVLATMLFVVALGGYQITRAAEIHRTLVFSERLVVALRYSADLVGRTGAVVVVPSDPVTERYLRESIGGYLPLVLKYASDGSGVAGAVRHRDDPSPTTGLRLVCEYADGRVGLRRE
jgi:hypothetical protein